MKLRKSFQTHILFAALLTALLCFAHAVQAQQDWKATVGGQSADMSKQAVAFLPDELWIHAGDSITWTFNSGDIHTVTFLTVGQGYPFDQSNGCPPITLSGQPFDGSSCVSSAPLTLGQTYQVIFPKAGNYEIVCLVHGQMFGTIHVLDLDLPLPHDQAYYDKQAKQQLQALLEDADLQQQHAEHQHCVVTTDPDGTPHVTISSAKQNVHSGLIAALLEDEPGVPQGPVAPPTRFRITFSAPGTYPYVCAFHDNLGMEGKVVVLP
jgi:plastocyanin